MTLTPSISSLVQKSWQLPWVDVGRSQRAWIWLCLKNLSVKIPFIKVNMCYLWLKYYWNVQVIMRYYYFRMCIDKNAILIFTDVLTYGIPTSWFCNSRLKHWGLSWQIIKINVVFLYFPNRNNLPNFCDIRSTISCIFLCVLYFLLRIEIHFMHTYITCIPLKCLGI